ncbi:MAG: C4-dicarboxylic acid transporter DauA [Bacteroidia bacterium]|nr:C4-dicarboxylic acid transporter DauA [Bacteroidia bacterium]
MKSKSDFEFLPGGYNATVFGKDVSSGLVVFLVALPLCLGIALASGAPLFAGVIAGVVGGIVVGSLSGSPLGVSGPAAGLVVIVLTALQTLGSYEAFLLAVVFAGAIQLLAGYVNAGIIAYYFPSAVIKGMLAAIGLTLILKEIPHALGYDADFIGDEAFIQKDGHNTFTEIGYAIQYHNDGAVIIALVSIALLILFDRPFMKKIGLFKFLPGALFVVMIGIGLNLLFNSLFPKWEMGEHHLVELPVASSPAEFFGFFTLPDFTAWKNPQVYITALTLAIVASIETLLCVEATDKLDPHRRNTPTNRELKAQGVGNIVSGLIGGIPVTQVIVRSSANINSGGQTKVATIVHGVILLVSAVVIPTFLNMIPLAALAGILLMVGYKLSKLSLYKEMYRNGWDQFIPFIVTVVAILSTDLLKGIGIGMVFALFFILRRNYKYAYHYSKERGGEKETIRLTLSEDVTFLNKGSLALTLSNLPDNCKVIIDGSKSQAIDYDVLETIHDFKKHTAPFRNITVETINIKEPEFTSSH